MLDRIQEIVVLQSLEKACSDRRYFVAAGRQITHQIFQAASVNACMALKSLQRIDLLIKLVINLTANVTAREDGENLQQCGNRGAGRPVIVPFAVAKHWMVQKLKPEERPHTL